MPRPLFLTAAILMAAWILASSCGEKSQSSSAANRGMKNNQANKKSAANGNKWIGNWERRTWQANAGLEITAVSNDSLLFTLSSSDGGHSGEIAGKAYFHNGVAVFTDSETAGCKLTMKLKDKAIIVDDNNTCADFGGMGVDFSGTFVNSRRLPKKKAQTLISLDILTPAQDAVFRKLVDTDYQHFVSYTELIEDRTGEKYLDSFPAKVIESGVRGMYTYMEYVIMVDEDNHFWAAILNDQKVNYYSNDKDYLDKLPNTIEDWRSRFKDYPVIFAKKE